MNEVQDLITQLREKGWTVAAIADELQVNYDTVARWQKGTRSPANEAAVRVFLDQLMRRRRIPKQRRYKKSPPVSRD
jgi:orotate phosphoribosyltransferase-like protein